MKHFTLYTVQYKQLLENTTATWAADNKIVIKNMRWLQNNPAFGVYIQRVCPLAEMTQGVMALLTAAAMQENPVYRHAPKLQEMAQTLQSAPLYAESVNKLKAYLRANNSLHVEGYVMFCMEEYRSKLDMVSYCAIKKMREHGHLQ